MPKRVLVIGGGAAGTAAAWSLSRQPQRFAVTLWEAADALGGVATTETLSLPDGSEVAANDGVQGGALSYRNSLRLHSSLGFEPEPVRMTVQFGRGAFTWSNVGAPSELVLAMQPHIERFGRVLRFVNRFSPIYAFVRIRTVLRRWRFPQDFGERLVYPLTALFFGTGNRTPEVSAAVVARVFLDAKLRLFDYDPQRLLSEAPEMFAFKPLRDIYAALGSTLQAAGVTVCLSRPVASLRRCRWLQGGDAVVATDGAGVSCGFDEVIFACPADVALRCLGADAGWWERRVLGSVRYYEDVTVTHSDADYMANHFEMGRGTDYFIRTDEADASKVEMAFDLGHYQPALRGRPADASPIFQTIFLDRERTEARWTRPLIDPAKVLLVKWWHAFSHEVSHFRRVVPFVRCCQGARGCTYYAGSWVLVNTHEIAVISGLAAAWRLGAPYPYADDELAASQFDALLFVAHGRLRR